MAAICLGLNVLTHWELVTPYDVNDMGFCCHQPLFKQYWHNISGGLWHESENNYTYLKSYIKDCSQTTQGTVR